ncbi:hypothetical protein ES332_D03G103400v1 [Gossypium tomentosum]|uniref:Uncharacterized protein n=1 Tax=Gossypium tomentosum TaxID=34277 RepID=A0A5D2LL24_GOSTO|nr:hypothetical protein ES332_D03G103400v1 [Gossypium tomentosum]
MLKIVGMRSIWIGSLPCPMGVFYLFSHLLFMDTKLMFWSCQGVGHPHFHRFIKEYTKELSPDLVGFFYTRISDSRVDDVIEKLGFQNSFKIEAIGFSWGIWLLWSDNIKVDVIDLHSQMVNLKIVSR